MRSLLVEDNPADVRLIREMLKEASGTLQLQHVARLDSALERLRQETFDVVLLDLSLPDSQGMSTLTSIQKARGGLPIVVLTGLDDESFAFEAVRAGAQDYLIKGRFESELLVRAIRYAVERKRAEEALRASEERWATTLRSIGDAVISTCAVGKITFMNDVAQKLTGWSVSEAEGRHLDDVFNIVQEITRIKPESPVGKVIRSGLVVGLANHTLLIRRDGVEIPIEDSGAPIRDGEGNIQGVVLVFHDVSEQRKIEAALRTSERLATTGRLAANIAHEIHNPLEAVGNLIFLMREGTKDETLRKYASMASEELARVTQMTQQMLSFQRNATKPVAVDIREVLDNVLALWQRKIASTGIQVEMEVDYDSEILALPGELRQIFANLVGNAVEAMGANHGKLRIRASASRDWHRGQTGLRVAVADNGPGIPAEIRDKILDPFFTTKGESGTGLGLWITADIVRKYDGTMRLRSTTRLGRSGTCFSVFFPMPTDSPDHS